MNATRKTKTKRREGMKKCRNCGERRPAEDYGTTKSGRLSTVCSVCAETPYNAGSSGIGAFPAEWLTRQRPLSSIELQHSYEAGSSICWKCVHEIDCRLRVRDLEPVRCEEYMGSQED